MIMTKGDLIEKLEEMWEDIFNEDLDIDSLWVKIETVHEYNEWDGNDMWIVYYIKEHDTYLHFFGRYSSWDSSEYEGMEEVYPHAKFNIEYLPQKQDQEWHNEELKKMQERIVK